MTRREEDEQSSTGRSYIALSDEPDVIRRKIKRAVTKEVEIIVDPEKTGAHQPDHDLHGLLTDMEPGRVQEHFAGKGYGAFNRSLRMC